MADNENGQRPVRKLTVKNFSVIKDAELEFGKITVLIGPQASGKSLLCKLAYFLGKEVLDSAVASSTSGISFAQFQEQIELSFTESFPSLSGIDQELLVEYSFGTEWIRVSSRAALAWPYGFEFCERFVSIYNSALEHRPSQELAAVSISDKQDAWYVLFRKLFSDEKEFVEFTYIPDGRTLLADPATSVAALQNLNLDRILRSFASQISWNSNWKVGLVTFGSNAQVEILKKIRTIIRGEILVVGNKPLFRANDGRNIPIQFLSSGTQELLPMFNVLERLIGIQEHREAVGSAVPSPAREAVSQHSRNLIVVEEPELSLFPNSQYDLVQLFALMSGDPIFRFDWVLTTHSPYILSSFNNLILAGQLGRDTQLKKKIKIDEKYWVAPNSLKAYSVHDGKTQSILSNTGLINGEYLDKISETIGAEFDELLRLEYGKKKVS